jgi:hypothetical protein
MVTTFPPSIGPLAGLTAVTVGADTVWYVKWSADEVADVPAPVATVTSIVAALWAGAVAVIWVEEFTEKLVAAVTPKETAVTPTKLVPVIVTVVPPPVGPEVGLTAVTVGAVAL